VNICIVYVVCARQIQANVRVLTQERDNVNALYSEVDINKLTFIHSFVLNQTTTVDS